MRDILLGVSLTCWIFTVISVVYVLWRYVYTPWIVMRKDIQNLSGMVEAMKQRPIEQTDEQVAMIERRLKARGMIR